MEAPCAGPGDSPCRFVVGSGQLVTGAELEVIVHGDVWSQHFQIQAIGILTGQEGVESTRLGLHQYSRPCLSFPASSVTAIRGWLS